MPPKVNLVRGRKWDGSPLDRPERLAIPLYVDTISGTHTPGWRTIVQCQSPSRGNIQFCVVRMNASSSGPEETDGRIRLVIDGNPIVTSNAGTLPLDYDRGVSLVGVFDFNVDQFGMACGICEFMDSFEVQWYAATSDPAYSMTVECAIQYFLLSGTEAV